MLNGLQCFPPTPAFSNYTSQLLGLSSSSAIHAETQAYTCQINHTFADESVPYELQWDAYEMPGERFLGSFGWVADNEIIENIKAEFAKGEAIRLFTFNSDSDLVWENILVPLDKGIASHEGDSAAK